MRKIIYPYKLGSASAKALASALDALRVKPDGRYRVREGDLIINWGNSTVPNWLDEDTPILNHPENVALASNKLKTLRHLTEFEVPTLEWTTDWNVASDWDARTYVRHKLTGHSGEGIEVFEGEFALPQAPLYTKAKENNGEYRVHVFNGEVIDYRKKSRLRDDEPSDEQSLIRTHGNGWIFRQDNLRRLERIENLAKRAIQVMQLDFGAVDIIKDENGDVFVIEVNTAVALEGATLDSYVNAINNYGT